MARLWPFRRRPRPDVGAPRGGQEHLCLAAGGPRSGEPRYSIAEARVLRSVEALTEDDAVELLALGIRDEVTRIGPKRAALRVGCSDTTIADARDQRTTLRLDLAWNTLLLCEGALDPLARHFGKALVDIDPRPVSWLELAAAASEYVAAASQALARGRITHLDEPKLKELARRLCTLSQGAGR